MQRIKIDSRHDPAKLREALDGRGFQSGVITEAEGGLYLDVPDEVDALEVDSFAQSQLAPLTGAAVIARLAAIDIQSLSSFEEWKEAVAPVIDEARAVSQAEEASEISARNR